MERTRGIGYMVAAVFVFSIMDALMKRLSSHYGPLQVGCLRSVSSLLFLLLPIAWRGSWTELRPKNPAMLLIRALLGITMLGSFVFAVHRLSMAQAYSLCLAAPLLMTALSVPIQGEHVSGHRWLAIAVGFGGVLVILRPWGQSGFSMLAAAAAAVATIAYSLNALTLRSLGRGNSSVSLVFWYLLLVSIGCGLLTLGDWHRIEGGDWGWLIGVGLSGALGQLWLTSAFRRAPPSVVGPFEYTSILWAFVIDWIFWSVAPSMSLIAGAAIVILSGIFILLDERRIDRVREASTPEAWGQGVARRQREEQLSSGYPLPPGLVQGDLLGSAILRAGRSTDTLPWQRVVANPRCSRAPDSRIESDRYSGCLTSIRRLHRRSRQSRSQ